MVTATDQPRVVLVTGATRGIGRAVAEGLAARGHVVFLGSRDLDRGRATTRDIPGDVRVTLIDVTDRNAIRRTHDLVREEFGDLDGLVNNAAINVSWDVPPRQTRIEDMRAVFDTDVFGAVEVTRAFIPPPARISLPSRCERL